MKILVFSAYYEPEIFASMHLLTNLFEDLAGYGSNVDVFVPTPTRGVQNETRKIYKSLKTEIKCEGKLKIHRFFMLREGKTSLFRAIRYLVVNLAFLLKGLMFQADVIFVQSTPPTQGAMAAILKKLKKVPFVYNLQDIFPDSLVNTGLTKQNSLLWKIGRKIEKFTYKNADKIIVISEDFKNNLLAKGVSEKKIEVIYNWVDDKALSNIKRKQNKLFDKYSLDKNKFYITYCGNIGLTQNMDMLVDVANELKQYEDIMFVLVGDGSYKTEIDKQILEKNIKNIKMIPFQPYEDISHVFSLGDVGLIISKENVGQNSVPSKTWSIMAAECPILASFDNESELCNVIRKSNSGVCVQAEQKEKLKLAILFLYNNKADAVQMGLNGREFVLGNLTREIGTSKYNSVINQLISENRGIKK